MRRLLTANSLFDVDSIRVGEGEATYRTERDSGFYRTERGSAGCRRHFSTARITLDCALAPRVLQNRAR
jgi:hypothetical protein